MGFQGLRATGTGAKGSRSRGVAHRGCRSDGEAVQGGYRRRPAAAHGGAQGLGVAGLLRASGSHGSNPGGAVKQAEVSTGSGAQRRREIRVAGGESWVKFPV